MGYLPLDALKLYQDNSNKSGWGGNFVYGDKFWQAHLKELEATTKVFGFKPDIFDKYTEEEFCKYILRRDLLINWANANLYGNVDSLQNTNRVWDKDLDDLLIKIFNLYVEEVYKDNNFFEKHPNTDVRTEIRDIFIQGEMLNRWAKNKQVLKIDPTFASHLLQTEKLVLTKDVLVHPMYNEFYLDLSDCKEHFGDISGAFVFITNIEDDEYSVTTYMLTDRNGGVLYSYYSSAWGLDTKDAEIDVSYLGDEYEEHQVIQDSNETILLPTKNIKVLVFQLLNYMHVKEPDIVPEKNMAFTYKPNKFNGVIKNKFNEVFINEVGVRMGKSINFKKKAVEKAYMESDEYKKLMPSKRKPPCAHYRRAHWQVFWTGKGRTTPVRHWIEPVFVCGSFSSDVVIHNVEKGFKDNVDKEEDDLEK